MRGFTANPNTKSQETSFRRAASSDPAYLVSSRLSPALALTSFAFVESPDPLLPSRRTFTHLADAEVPLPALVPIPGELVRLIAAQLAPLRILDLHESGVR